MKIDKQKIGVFIMLNVAFFIYSLSNVIAKLNTLYFEPFSIQFFFVFSIQLFIMVVYTVIWQFTIKKIDLNAAFSLKVVTILWSLVFARYIFKETITITNLIGVGVIMLGIMVVVKDE